MRLSRGVPISVIGRIGVLWREQRYKNADVRRPEMCQGRFLRDWEPGKESSHSQTDQKNGPLLLKYFFQRVINLIGHLILAT